MRALGLGVEAGIVLLVYQFTGNVAGAARAYFNLEGFRGLEGGVRV